MMKFFYATLILLGFASSAEAADAVCAPQNLGLVFDQARTTLSEPVSVQLRLIREGVNRDHLRVSFNVRIPESQIFVRPGILGPNQYPYQRDVVELFLSVNGQSYPYYEFELSPANQSFVVKIPGRGQAMENNFPVEVFNRAQVYPDHWTAEMLIPLRDLGWDGDPTKILGNAYAIFGQTRARSFWALPSMPPQRRANFHQPQYFEPLLNGCL